MRTISGGALKLSGLVAALACLTLVGGWPAGAAAQQDDKPKAPKSVEVQAYVILASKGEVEHVDPALKELAELLQKRFKDQFNRFRLYKQPHDEVKLDKASYLALAEAYYLKVNYTGVTTGQPEMVKLTLTVVKRIAETAGGKTETREVTVGAPLSINVVRGKFILIGGPAIGQETMILAVRVVK